MNPVSVRLHTFPLRLVEHFDSFRGVWHGRRGFGRELGRGSYRFGQMPVTDLQAGPPTEAGNHLALTAHYCDLAVRRLLRRHRTDRGLDGLVRGLADREWVVAFMEGHDYLLQIDIQAEVLYVASDAAAALGLSLSPASGQGDGGIAASERGLGFELLLGLGFLHLWSGLSGLGEREALRQVLQCYQSFSVAERLSLHQLLRGEVLDSGNLFSLFLERAASLPAGASLGGNPADQPERWITWLLGQDWIDLPYDRVAVLEILRSEADADAKRLQLYRLLRGYDRALEQRNIDRIAAETRAAGQQLIFGRMSRAFHNQAILFADAVLLQACPHWRELAEHVAALAEGCPELQAGARDLQQMLGGAEEVPLTSLEGALEHFEEAVLEIQKQELLGLIRQSRVRLENHNDPSAGNTLPVPSRLPIMTLTEQRLQGIERLRQEFLQAGHRRAAYVIISQRPSPTGSHLLVKINEAEEPYPGKPENLRKLSALSGDRVYSSPDYGWLEVADHWIEAIPLFIKEEVLLHEGQETTRTVIDIASMEASFREEMADLWARNIRRVMASEFLSLAREQLAAGGLAEGGEKALPHSPAPVAGPADIAALGVLIGEIYRREADRIHRSMELEEIPAYQALRRILPGHPLLGQVKARRRDPVSWHDATREVLCGAGYGGNFELEVERLLPQDLQPLRPLPALHVLTTQSAGMTEGYIRTWLEESMALYNIVEDFGLGEAVAARQKFFANRIHALAVKVIREWGVWTEVEEICLDEQISEVAAVRRVVDRNRTVQEELSTLGVLLEYEEMSRGRGDADACEEPDGVRECLQQAAASLQESALDQVAARNGESLRRQAEELCQRHAGLRERDAMLQLVREDEFLRADWLAYQHFAARRLEIARLDAADPGLHLEARRQDYLRRFQQLGKTTARKEIIAERGLNHLSLHPFYFFQASGGGKRYHLLYTPSRVDLGKRERESVEDWSQWVGAADLAAVVAGKRIYRLINKDVRTFASLCEPEILKTGENASMTSHFGFSNALGLMVTASRHGDIEDMADCMNRRHDRLVHPAGEGYGGYCVPKDGLFLEFVLSLGQAEKLRQIGLPEVFHRQAVAMAHALLARKPEFSSRIEWEAWAAEQLQKQEFVKPYFHLRQGSPVFQITRIADVLENLGKPDLLDGFRVTATLAAHWGLHKMVTGGEQVNRFMPFFKTWLMRQGLAEAARRHPQRAIATERFVAVLTAEYKPDTQDGRFAVGMRKFEILAGIGDHLLHALDLDGQAVASLMREGFGAVERRGKGARILDMLALERTDHGAIGQLRKLFPNYAPPLEIRLVSPTGLSTQDLLQYTSDTRLDAIAEEVRQELLDFGLSDKEIEANLRSWGPRLSEWDRRGGLEAGLPQALQERLGGRLHALALKVLGPERDYPSALQGADLLDVGIPHQGLLDLLGDPARICRLMLEGNPDSALVIVDGASGARHRAMNRLDVMLWFAAGERIGREAVYVSVGLGQATVEAWRASMRRQRSGARQLAQALAARDREGALRCYASLVDSVRQEWETQPVSGQLDKLRRFGRDRERDHLLGQILGRIGGGLPLQQIGFTDFLALGGIFLLNGAGAEEIAAARASFDAGIARLGGGHADERQVSLLLCPDISIGVMELRQEKGVESSNKAVEERPELALKTRRQLAHRITQAQFINQRYAAFSSVADDGAGFDESYRQAMAALGAADRAVSETAFGAFLGHARNALTALPIELSGGAIAEQFQGFQGQLKQLFGGRRIDQRIWQQIAGGYEEIGLFGHLSQAVLERSRSGEIDDSLRLQHFHRIAQAAELFYMALAIDGTIDFPRQDPETLDPPALWRSLADFFAKTINDHFYEYRPWAYSRGIGFAEFEGEALYQLAVRHHRWLYRHLRFLVTGFTELRERSVEEQDLLLGVCLDGRDVAAIGTGADGPAEKAWRCYGQLRELAFIRNDGFPLPPVFAEFDPDLIRDRQRVNHVFAAPVGRTHFSRALREGPTLARQLEEAGRSGANLVITRKLDIHTGPDYPRAVVQIHCGHFYLDAATYRDALVRHQGLAPDAAERLAAQVHPKGIRVAARFSRPLLAALVYPFHGDPLYSAGKLEECGLPYAVQSLFHTWTTYDKAKYPDLFRGFGVDIPDEIDWLAAYTRAGPDEAAIKGRIRDGLEDTAYPGLAAFSRRHPLLMIKDAAESGGRNAGAFMLRRADGTVDEAQMSQAVDFIHQISLQHNVAIQEVVLSSPEHWASETFMRAFVHRQIVDWGSPVNRLRRPLTPIYGSHRIIMSTDNPGAADAEKKWHISHWITLNSKQLITNVGRGGSLEQFLPEFIRPEHRQIIVDQLAAAGRRAMAALAAAETRYAEDYARETGRPVGKDLMGISYGSPRYMMLDFLIAPEFAEEGILVEVRPDFDAAGRRQGSKFILQRSGRSFPGTLCNWRVVLIEPNIGVGLWDRVALREESREAERAQAEERGMDWDRIGENARIVLADLSRAGEEYLQALRGGHAGPR